MNPDMGASLAALKNSQLTCGDVIIICELVHFNINTMLVLISILGCLLEIVLESPIYLQVLSNLAIAALTDGYSKPPASCVSSSQGCKIAPFASSECIR